MTSVLPASPGMVLDSAHKAERVLTWENSRHLLSLVQAHLVCVPEQFGVTGG